jgi:AraC family transcriptional regulator, transcriptional activator of pobA
MAPLPRIPAFLLYGDPAALPIPRFVHAERIVTRSRIHDWRIGTHRHPDLSQALILTSGSGLIEIEGVRTRFTAPWIIWLPAAVVHGFHFDTGTDGYVVTVSNDFLTAIISDENARDLAGIAETLVSEALEASEPSALDLAGSFDAIFHAASLLELGSRTVVEAHLKIILVGLARLQARRHAEAPHGASRSATFRRFRQLVEQHFRGHWSVARYAAAIAITEDRLYDLCLQVAGKPPQSLLHDRLLLEAKRDLLYTTLAVSEICYGLGFKDPAYFCRFFTKRTGLPPTAFRRQQGGLAPPSPRPSPAVRARETARSRTITPSPRLLGEGWGEGPVAPDIIDKTFR